MSCAEQAQSIPNCPDGRRSSSGRARSSCRRIRELFLLWDLDNYFCAYPLCEVSGGAGAKLAWSWAESLYLPKSRAKGNRNEFIGKNFRGMTDTFSARWAARTRNSPRSGGAPAAGA